MSIIKSIVDVDYYKLAMQQLAFHQFPDTICTYEFKCRSGENLAPYKDEIQEEINTLKDLKLTGGEWCWLHQQPEFQSDYLHWLNSFKLNPNLINISVDDGILKIDTEPAKWIETIMFETMILAIVNEFISATILIKIQRRGLEWKTF